MASKLSISRAWDETRGVLQSDGKLFATVALALLVLPGIIANMFLPAAKPNKLPEPGAWMIVFLVGMLVALAGQIALARLALGNRPTVGEAITRGFQRMPIYFVSQLIWAFPFAVAFVLLARSMQAAPNAMSSLLFLISLVGFFVVAVRFTLTAPVTAAEDIGPLAILRRSWDMTAGNWWRLFGFLIVFLIGAGILILATYSIFGLLARTLFGELEPFTVGSLLVSLAAEIVQAGAYVVLMVMLARLYLQASIRGAQASVPSSGT